MFYNVDTAIGRVLQTASLDSVPSLPHPCGSSVGLPCAMFRSLTWPSWALPTRRRWTTSAPRLSSCTLFTCAVSGELWGYGQRGSRPEPLPWPSLFLRGCLGWGCQGPKGSGFSLWPLVSGKPLVRWGQGRTVASASPHPFGRGSS